MYIYQFFSEVVYFMYLDAYIENKIN